MKKKRRRGNGEGTIFEDKKNKRWIGQYILGIAEDGKAIRKSVYGKTQKEIINKLNEVKYQMNNDIYVEKNGIKLVKILEKKNLLLIQFLVGNTQGLNGL